MKHVSRRMGEYEITLASAAGTLTAPSAATDGVAVPAAYAAAYGTRGSAPRKWLLSVDGSTTISMTSGKLYRYDAAAAKWRAVATLATPIALTSAIGYEVVLEDIGGGSRYAISATLDTGNVTVKLTPMDVQG